MIIYYGSTDISSYVTSYTRIEEVEGSRLFGLTPSVQLEIKLNNESGVFNEFDTSLSFLVYEDNEHLLGSFQVYEKPEKWSKVITVTLFDQMAKTNIAYNSQVEYPCRIQDQLLEMSELCGVGINYGALNCLDKEINWYDNTVSIRDYLGWIAELEGKFVRVNEFGLIDFKRIEKTPVLNLGAIFDYKKEEQITISRVCFDNGIIKLEEGTEDEVTTYLSSDNPYIDSSYDIEPVFNYYNQLSFYPVESVKIHYHHGIRVLDHIQVDTLFNFIITKVTFNYLGGDSPKITVEGTFESKNAELLNNRFDHSTRIKRISVNLDANNQRLEIVAKDIIDGLGKLSSFEQSLDGFKQTVSKVEETTTNNKELIEEINAQKMYRVVIMSSHGNIFKNGEIETELRAVLYSWDKNITDEFDASRFRWTRLSENTQGDLAWNTSHYGGSKTIRITSDDVYARATFQVDVLDAQGKSLI